jgi:hypothetical protein
MNKNNLILVRHKVVKIDKIYKTNFMKNKDFYFI